LWGPKVSAVYSVRFRTGQDEAIHRGATTKDADLYMRQPLEADSDVRHQRLVTWSMHAYGTQHHHANFRHDLEVGARIQPQICCSVYLSA
jgi:hypothetical protein